jgi:hypothetical protein
VDGKDVFALTTLQEQGKVMSRKHTEIRGRVPRAVKRR